MTVDELRNWLEQMGDMRARCAQTFDGEYPEHFVLKRGFGFDRWVEPEVNMAQGECYSNAANYAMENGLLYAEGYAVGVIPLNHAWCVDPETGEVHDPTWWQFEWHHETPPVFFGLLLQPRDLWTHIGRTGYYSLFDGHNYAATVDLLRGKTRLPFLTKEDCPWMP